MGVAQSSADLTSGASAADGTFTGGSAPAPGQNLYFDEGKLDQRTGDAAGMSPLREHLIKVEFVRASAIF